LKSPIPVSFQFFFFSRKVGKEIKFNKPHQEPMTMKSISFFTSIPVRRGPIPKIIFLRCQKQQQLQLFMKSYTTKEYTARTHQYEKQGIEKGANEEKTNNNSNNNNDTIIPLTMEQKEMIQSMLRVDHAGEIGANVIYAGQLAVLHKDKAASSLIQVIIFSSVMIY